MGLEDQLHITISIGPDPLGQALSLGEPGPRTTKSEADYRPAKPHDDANETNVEECGNCSNFSSLTEDEDSDGHCFLVAGLIKEDYVCDLFEEN